MTRIVLLASIVGLIHSIPAHSVNLGAALLGATKVIKDGAPQAVCNITFVSGSACTGALIGANQVATAAHCFSTMPAGSSSTGGYSMHPSQRKVVIADPISKIECGPQLSGFTEMHQVASVQISGTYYFNPQNNRPNDDFALITLSEPSKIPAMQPLTTQEWASYQKDPKGILGKMKDCGIAGFGLSANASNQANYGAPKQATLDPNKLDIMYEGTSPNIFLLEKAELKTEDLNKFKKLDHESRCRKPELSEMATLQKTLLVNMAGIFQAVAGDGDSGGPLYCCEKATTKCKLIGILSGGDSRMDDAKKSTLANGIVWGILRPDIKYEQVKLQ